MEGQGGGSSTPSYSNVVSSRSKEVSLNGFRKPTEVEKKRQTQKIQKEANQMNRNRLTGRSGGERLGDSSQKNEYKYATGPCKPRSTIKPRVVLNDPALQVHRDHMVTYAVICKFIGIWPIEKNLYTWIRNN